MLKDLNSARKLNGKYHEWLDERFRKNPIPGIGEVPYAFIKTAYIILKYSILFRQTDA